MFDAIFFRPPRSPAAVVVVADFARARVLADWFSTSPDPDPDKQCQSQTD